MKPCKSFRPLQDEAAFIARLRDIRMCTIAHLDDRHVIVPARLRHIRRVVRPVLTDPDMIIAAGLAHSRSVAYAGLNDLDRGGGLAGQVTAAGDMLQ